jgi:uncharacterized protein YndB with AHSA1/START domain
VYDSRVAAQVIRGGLQATLRHRAARVAPLEARMSHPEEEIFEVGAIQIDLEVGIDAPPSLVWKGIIEQTSRWWPTEFYATAKPKGIVIEPRPGGRMYEDAGDGGLLWYTVIAIDPPVSMTLAGHLAPPYGGPATSLMRLSLAPAGPSRTRLSVTDSVFGRLGPSSKKTIEAGWRQLFGVALKEFLEKPMT